MECLFLCGSDRSVVPQDLHGTVNHPSPQGALSSSMLSSGPHTVYRPYHGEAHHTTPHSHYSSIYSALHLHMYTQPHLPTLPRPPVLVTIPSLQQGTEGPLEVARRARAQQVQQDTRAVRVNTDLLQPFFTQLLQKHTSSHTCHVSAYPSCSHANGITAPLTPNRALPTRTVSSTVSKTASSAR